MKKKPDFAKLPAQPLKNLLPVVRSCGSCQACCTALAVAKFPKGENVRCKYQCDEGCSIYVRRPRECKDFACLWLAGALDLGDRPDTLGLLFYVAPFRKNDALYVIELEEGASDTHNGIAMIEFLRTRLMAYATVIRPLDTTKNRRYIPSYFSEKGQNNG